MKNRLFKKIAFAAATAFTAFSLTACGRYATKEIVTIAEDVEVVQISNKIAEVYQEVEKGCVGIATDKGSGSGVIYKCVNNLYYVVTNAHVVKDGTFFRIYMGNISYYEAELIGYDTTNDIGVLTFSPDLKDGKLYVHDIFNYDEEYIPNVGETVLAVGCPLGVDNYNILTTGVISSVGKNEISTDAALNPGNSGGGLFNMSGHLIGINYKKSTYVATSEYGDSIAVEGRGYVIPLDLVKKCITDIESTETIITRPLMGVTVFSYNRYLQDVQKNSAGYVDYTEYMPDGLDFGLVITAFSDEYPYGKAAGLQLNDVIFGVNGEQIHSLVDLSAVLHRMLPGESLTLNIYRIVDNQPTSMNVVVSFVD